MLHGHERAITQIVYNRDGDLLFSVAKDTKPTVWYSANGERLGTYDGHTGAIWCVDVNHILLLIFSSLESHTLRREEGSGHAAVDELSPRNTIIKQRSSIMRC